MAALAFLGKSVNRIGNFLVTYLKKLDNDTVL